MELISIFFILLSIMALGYIYVIIKSLKRLPILFELFLIGVYLVVLLIFLFPNVLRFIETLLGINSAINFILYLSIFVLYFIIFLLYRKQEEQRIEITKLVREIAYLKKK